MLSNSKDVRIRIMDYGQSRTKVYHKNWEVAGELWKSRGNPKTCSVSQGTAISYIHVWTL